MTTRIRYSESEGFILTDWYTVGPNLVVRGNINTTTFEYVVSELNGTIVDAGDSRSLREAKLLLKRALSESGVNFVGEIRNKRK